MFTCLKTKNNFFTHGLYVLPYLAKRFFFTLWYKYLNTSFTIELNIGNINTSCLKLDYEDLILQTLHQTTLKTSQHDGKLSIFGLI